MPSHRWGTGTASPAFLLATSDGPGQPRIEPPPENSVPLFPLGPQVHLQGAQPGKPVLLASTSRESSHTLCHPGHHQLPTLASSFLTSMTLESLKPGMRSSLQTTPASSSWLQSLFPQPRCLQSPMLFSLPAQFTLSSQIRPARHSLGVSVPWELGRCPQSMVRDHAGPHKAEVSEMPRVKLWVGDLQMESLHLPKGLL